MHFAAKTAAAATATATAAAAAARRIATIALVMALATATAAILAAPHQAAAATRAPSQPYIFLETSGETVTLNWDNISRAKGYQIRWSANERMTGSKSRLVKKNEATVTPPSPYTTYYYQVRAYALSGKKRIWGKWSGVASAYTNPLESYSWSKVKTLADRIAACTTKKSALAMAKSCKLLASTGKLTGLETKAVTLSDGEIRHVRILGFWHDNKTSGGKAGITFQFIDSVGTYAVASPKEQSADGRAHRTIPAATWENSPARQWLNSTVLLCLPYYLQQQIVAVNKPCNLTGVVQEGKTVESAYRFIPLNAGTTSDSLWLPSLSELVGTYDPAEYLVASDIKHSEATKQAYLCEGSQYQLFANCNIAKRVVTDDPLLNSGERKVTYEFGFLSECKFGITSEWTRTPAAYAEGAYLADGPRFVSISWPNPLISAGKDVHEIRPCFCL